jgi:23S rRNA pseudouridine2605 synthase
MKPKVNERATGGQAPRKRARTRPAPPKRDLEPMRIAKAIAHAGLCSRRDAEKWIEAGRVCVNGTVLTTPAHVVSGEDTILVDGEPLPSLHAPRLWRFNKPKGLVTSHKDPQGRPTVFANLPYTLPRVVSVGRLDINTEGLLLLTTDGALARHLELPSTGWVRRYRVRAHGQVSQTALDALKGGVTIDGVRYGPIEAKIERTQGSNVWLLIGLREGKNREVKRIAAHLGLSVNRLIRTSFGPFSLGDLPSGVVDEVKRKVIADQLGATLARELGVKS